MHCNFCKAPLTNIFIDLGHQPPSNAFLTKEQLDEPETYYPLKVYICDKCWLVQVPNYGRNLFPADYPYFSSESPANVSHAKEFTDTVCKRFGYGEGSKILEIGSNDGYMLQWFKEKGCDVLGIDPAGDSAIVANKKGILTYPGFFNSKMVTWNGQTKEGQQANFWKPEPNFDFICGINVLAHQPDINDFVEGLRIALKPDGVIVFEFPHLMKLVEGLQFDTIYHEHYSYFSFATICTIFQKHGLEVFDVEGLPTHGGSLRIYAQHELKKQHREQRAANLLLKEQNFKMFNLIYYMDFRFRISRIRFNIISFLLHNQGTVAYGAAAKSSTFFNYCGIRSDLIPFVADRSPHKQGKYLPGSHIRVANEDELRSYKPEYVLITAWNLKKEIMEQLSYIREWGGKFVVAIPELEIL